MHFATAGGPEQKQAMCDIWSLWVPSRIRERLNQSHLIWSISSSVGAVCFCLFNPDLVCLSFFSAPCLSAEQTHLCRAHVHFLPRSCCCKCTTDQPEAVHCSRYSPAGLCFFFRAKQQIRKEVPAKSFWKMIIAYLTNKELSRAPHAQLQLACFCTGPHFKDKRRDRK